MVRPILSVTEKFLTTCLKTRWKFCRCYINSKKGNPGAMKLPGFFMRGLYLD
jgi:hypothetical protein